LEIVQAAKKNSLPNRDTGKLHNSIKHKTAYLNDNKFTIEISMIDYGDYLNRGTRSNRGTHFLDKAIDSKVTAKSLGSIIDIIVDNMITIKSKK
jgi:hypothetical protein